MAGIAVGVIVIGDGIVDGAIVTGAGIIGIGAGVTGTGAGITGTGTVTGEREVL
jgi:hypothetical protein